MYKIDNSFLVRIGLGSLRSDLAEIAKTTAYELLQQRVGQVISSEMSEAQLVEFDSIYRSGDQAAAVYFLERHCPHYRSLVGVELQRLEFEIRAEARQVMEALDSLLGGEFLYEG